MDFEKNAASVAIINLKIESLIAQNKYSQKQNALNLVQHLFGDIYNALRQLIKRWVLKQLNLFLVFRNDDQYKIA